MDGIVVNDAPVDAAYYRPIGKTSMVMPRHMSGKRPRPRVEACFRRWSATSIPIGRDDHGTLHAVGPMFGTLAAACRHAACGISQGWGLHERQFEALWEDISREPGHAKMTR